MAMREPSIIPIDSAVATLSSSSRLTLRSRWRRRPRGRCRGCWRGCRAPSALGAARRRGRPQTRGRRRPSAPHGAPACCLSGSTHARGVERPGLSGPTLSKSAQPQLRDQPLGGRAASPSYSGCGLIVAGVALPHEPRLPHQRLGLHAHVLRVEILGAGNQPAEVALAAIQCARDHRRLRPRRSRASASRLCGSMGWPDR